ncbi:TetR/AcrR family transcriptional regulator [Candidatus Poriferisocius sp.]|uniref:TetR/AcrR family transcriptional regulator n=1 Tax=Candidatus Poriferisocius sp. TaxID=3101276 RepID=UPI003B015804
MSVQVSGDRTRALEEFRRWFESSAIESDDCPMGERILDAARRCYLRFGPTKMSMRDVADEAGVSRGSVYKYYQSRDQLLEELIDQGIGTFARTLDALMCEHDNLEAKLSEAVRLMWDGVRRRPRPPGHDSFAAAHLTSGSGPLIRATMAVIREHLGVAQASGKVRNDLDVDRGAEWVARNLIAAISMPGVTFDSDEVADVDRFICDFMIRGLD